MRAPKLSDGVWAPVERIVAHVRVPLYRNGYALIFSSAVTSGLGFLFWALAARLYSPEAVGLNSATISAMMFLAGISQLNLPSALMRFIPASGKHARRLTLYAYVISLVLAGAAGLLFAVIAGRVAPALSFVGSSVGFAVWFVASTMAWSVFVLQDGVLTGLRQAVWVPAGTAAFAVAKILLLLVFAAPYPQHGLFGAWTAALAVSLLPVSVLIFRVLFPRYLRRAPAVAVEVNRGTVARYVAADYVASWFWLAASLLLPVIVTERAGPAANAYYYLAWTIAYSLYLVSTNMGSSLIVEASRDPQNLRAHSRRALLGTYRLLVPVVALLVAGAPLILSIFGGSYASEGAWTLRLLALSALPNAINSLYVSIARVQRRMVEVIAVLAVTSLLILVLSVVLLPVLGIAGVGVAWLAGQSLAAGLVWWFRLRALWGNSAPRESSAT